MSQRLALIVGNSLYRDSTLSKLEAPEVDVGALADVLLDPDIGGFDDVKMVVNMSSASVRRAISEFYARRRQDDLLALYFSGHGVLDELGRLYLGLKDTDSRLLRGTAIPATFITDEMNNSHSQHQVLILDCCHSGAFARGTKGSPGASVGTATTFEGTGFGRVVLTASDATQFAFEGNQIIGEANASLFTHFLVEGLQSGNADANQDGQITIDELYDYIYEQVVTRTPKQTPGKWNYKMRGELVIARTPVAATPARFAPPGATADTDESFAAELDRRYIRGLSAFWLKEWDAAIGHFQAIVRLRPDYLDTAEKLEQAQSRKHIHELYTQAQDAADQQAWDQVILSLETVLEKDPQHSGALELIQKARMEKRILDLYAEAIKLGDASQWKAVLNVVDRIQQLAPDSEGAHEIREKAQEMARSQEREERLGDLYGRAVRALDAGNSELTRRLLRDVIQIQPDFEDATRLLARIESDLGSTGRLTTRTSTPSRSTPDERPAAGKQSDRFADRLESVRQGLSELWSKNVPDATKKRIPSAAGGPAEPYPLGGIRPADSAPFKASRWGEAGWQFFGVWMVTHLSSWMAGWNMPIFPGPFIESLVYGLGLGEHWIWIGIALLFGAVLGFGQWLALRRHFRHIVLWIPATALGWFTGQLFFLPLALNLSEVQGFDVNLSYILADTIRIAVGSTFQYAVLRKHLPRAIVWIPVATAAGFLGYLWRLSSLNYLINEVGWGFWPAEQIAGVLAGLILGLALGFTLLWLYTITEPSEQGR